MVVTVSLEPPLFGDMNMFSLH